MSVSAFLNNISKLAFSTGVIIHVVGLVNDAVRCLDNVGDEAETAGLDRPLPEPVTRGGRGGRAGVLVDETDGDLIALGVVRPVRFYGGIS